MERYELASWVFFISLIDCGIPISITFTALYIHIHVVRSMMAVMCRNLEMRINRGQVIWIRFICMLALGITPIMAAMTLHISAHITFPH